MPGNPIDDLIAATADGVDFEGLVATRRDDDSYRLKTPGASYDDLSESAFRDALADHGEYVREWHFWRRRAPEASHRWAFLRWLEDADARPVPDRRDALEGGRSRSWGQLLVTVRIDESGRRSYGLRHEADEDEVRDDLEVRRDPADAADLARYDDRGEYRPLSTAPTLRTGWAFVDLGPAAAVRAVDRFYPATIANWYREREGRLDVTHWREAAARQTGIYDVVDELEGEQVARLAETHCVDSQCLKRRAWDESGDRPIDVPRGDGEFPCREPCSLVVAAARELAIGDGEDPGDGGESADG